MKKLCLGLVSVAALLLLSVSSLPAEDGFKSIFDGKSLDGWEGKPEFWSVQDGAITGITTPENPTKANTFIIWKQGTVDDFELKLQYRIVDGNSGIQYRSTDLGDYVVKGYQADFEAGTTYSGINYEERGRGILAKRGKKVVAKDGKGPYEKTETFADTDELQSKIKQEDWNEYHIIAKGNHLIHKINGNVTCEVIDEGKKDSRRSGILALQLHQGPPMKVQFKDIQLKRLKLEDKKKVVFVPGKPSHGYGSHEHLAGCRLLMLALTENMSENFEAAIYEGGWPSDPTAFDNADAVVVYGDGGGRHLLNDHLEEFDKLMKKGVGLAQIHYAVETPKDIAGDEFLDWMGGYFEAWWSVNPHWEADFKSLPDHPITRGVKPFAINDEWYYNMRFRENMENVTPILTAVPPESTLSRPDGAHSGNPHVRAMKGQPQHVAWAATRPDGGRGFGFTGGHFHNNWANEDFRTVVLNAICWVSQVEVPEDGVSSETLSQDDLEGLIPRPKPKPKKKVSQKAKSKPTVQLAMAAISERDPEQAVAGLDVFPGLQATLVASEPDLKSLTNIDIDHRGRIWVCDVMNYRRNNGSRPEGDRILILEDTNGDGVADKTKTYFQGHDVDTAMGICVLGNRVIVSATPNIIVFTDEDGDDKPDKKEFLFTKTGQPQHDHSAHSFLFGPDGKLYWNVGNTGKAVYDAEGKMVVDLAGNQVVDNGKPYFGGMPFRCNLDGSEFEVLGHNFRNNYETTVDSFGTLWQSDNDDDGNRAVRINYVMQYGNYGYRDQMTGAGWRDSRTNMEQEIPLRHWHLNDPGVVPNLLQTGAGSPTGICVYEGDLLPEIFRNQVIHCDAGPNVVRAYPVQKDGAGYSAKMVDVLVGARDNWFRPADICVAPDGSLFVSDWYDPGVGGHHQRDLDRGRLFRVAPTGSKYNVPKFDFDSIEGCIEALKNPNLSVRYMAWTNLHAQGQKAESVLRSAYDQTSNDRFKARLLWLLGKIDGQGEKYVFLALQDKNPNIRITGLRLAQQLKMSAVDVVTKVVKDSSPQVRRSAAIALRFDGSPEASELWAKLASQHDGKDRWYLEALGIGADRFWDDRIAAYLKSHPKDDKAARDIIWRSRAQETPIYLYHLLVSDSTPDEELVRYFRAMDFQPNQTDVHQAATKLAFGNVRQGDTQRTIIFEALQRLDKNQISNSPELTAELNEALGKIKGTSQYVELVGQFQLDSHYPELLSLAIADPNSGLGVAAADTLARKGQQKLIFATLKKVSPAEQTALMEAVANGSSGQALSMMRRIVNQREFDAALKRIAIKGMARNKNTAKELLELTKAGKLSDDLKQAAAAPLSIAVWDDVREAAKKLFPTPPSKDNKPLPPLDALVKMRGDVQNGAKLFATTATCNKCHIVRKQGKEVGPDLSEIGSKLSREAMFESILYPSAGISHNYENYAVLLENGTAVTGLKTSESDQAITIVTSEGVNKVIPQEEVEEIRKLPISIMPNDLQKLMTVQELADVVEYMTTLKK